FVHQTSASRYNRGPFGPRLGWAGGPRELVGEAVMRPAKPLLFATTVAGAALTIVLAPIGFAQSDVQPTNDLPNPYQSIEGWAKLPEGRAWGSTSAVDIDKDGSSVWVAERCGGNSRCLESPTVDPILKFDSSGKLVKSFGAGMVVSPHGIFVDRDG